MMSNIKHIVIYDVLSKIKKTKKTKTENTYMMSNIADKQVVEGGLDRVQEAVALKTPRF